MGKGSVSAGAMPVSIRRGRGAVRVMGIPGRKALHLRATTSHIVPAGTTGPAARKDEDERKNEGKNASADSAVAGHGRRCLKIRKATRVGGPLRVLRSGVERPSQVSAPHGCQRHIGLTDGQRERIRREHKRWEE